MRIFTAFAVMAVSSLFAAEHIWNLKDGTGNVTLKDSGDPAVDMTIVMPDKVTWAREDDRGFFLNFNNGFAKADATQLQFRDGIDMTVRFAVDLKALEVNEWFPLVTCGNDFQSGYCVWLRQNGDMLVCFPGSMMNWYHLFKAQLVALRDYTLRVVRGNGKVQILLDGDLIDEYPCEGELRYKEGEPFRLGSSRSWPFYGNVYSLAIRDFSEGSLVKDKKPIDPKYPAEEIHPVPEVTDPEGTVLLKDFELFSPAPYINPAPVHGKWTFRKGVKFFAPVSDDALVLNANPYARDEFSCNPGLEGKYDVYVCVRATSNETDFIVRIGDEKECCRVQVGAATPYLHPNTEVLLEQDVAMDGKSISILPGSKAMIGYFKFIPSANRRKIDYPKWRCVKLSRTDKAYAELSEDKANALVDNGTLKERHFVDDAKLPEFSAESLKRGYSLCAQDWMDLLFVNSKPKRDDGNLTLVASACPGEFEPMSFAVYGIADCGKMTLELEKPFDGAGIQAEITVVESIPKRTTNFHGASEFVNGPQYLCRKNALELGAGQSRQFWITVHASEDTKPGTYNAVFALRGKNGDTRIPARLTVRNFKLVENKAVRMGFFLGNDVDADFRTVVKNQAEHGSNFYFLDLKDDVTIVKQDDGSYKVDFEKSSFVEKATYMIANGMDLVIFSNDNMTRFMYANYREKPEVYTAVLKEIVDYFKDKGWTAPAFFTRDEVLSEAGDIKLATWEMKALKAAGGIVWSDHIWYKTSRPYQKEVDLMAPMIDVFVNRFSTRRLWYVDDWQTMQDTAEAKGKELWSYNIDNAVMFAQAAMKRFAFGWFFRTIGAKTRGQALWTYNYVTNSPYTDLDGGTDWMYDFPPYGKNPGGFAIDFEAIREGADDFRYIMTLEAAMSDAEKQGKDTSEAKKLLADIKASFDFGENFFSKSVFLDSKFEKQWEEGGKLFCSGRFNLPNGWTFENYHEAREKIAQEIEKLK